MKRIIVGISGASGFLYGVEALQQLKAFEVEVHLVMSGAADQTRAHETDLSKEAVLSMADVVHETANVGASIASGSFQTIGMLVAPCSMGTLAAIAHGTSDNLLTRAADVVLKERRRLVLLTRETPLHLVHLRNMTTVTEMGGMIFPPVPAMYQQFQNVHEIIAYSVARALSMFGLVNPEMKEWQG